MQLNETNQKISAKRLAANRANALRSTGPRTPGGKRNSAATALRHGILAKAILVEGESTGRFLTLIGDLTRDFRPATAYEHLLIETMASAKWRQQRILDVQTATINREQYRQLEAAVALGEETSPLSLVARSLEAIDEKSRRPGVFSYYEAEYERQFHRAGDRLRQIQAERNAEKVVFAKRSHQAIENKEEA